MGVGGAIADIDTGWCIAGSEIRGGATRAEPGRGGERVERVLSFEDRSRPGREEMADILYEGNRGKLEPVVYLPVDTVSNGRGIERNDGTGAADFFRDFEYRVDLLRRETAVQREGRA